MLRVNLDSAVKRQMKVVERILEKTRIPKAYSSLHATKLGLMDKKFTGPRSQATKKKYKSLDPRTMTLGKTRHLHTGEKKLSVATKRFPRLYKEIKFLIYLIDPTFKCNAIQVNENTIAERHKDNSNVGFSYLMGLGKYNGGLTKIYKNDDDEKGKTYSIKHKILYFDGSKLPHESTPFKGKRYSLVFFRH